MGEKETKTLEDGMRGLIIRFDPAAGITADRVGDAIDLHVIPPLTIAHSELCEMITGDPINDNERERAWGYLAIIQIAIILLARIGEEAQKDFQRRNSSGQAMGCGNDS
jgi:hypothetical protein